MILHTKKSICHLLSKFPGVEFLSKSEVTAESLEIKKRIRCIPHRNIFILTDWNTRSCGVSIHSEVNLNSELNKWNIDQPCDLKWGGILIIPLSDNTCHSFKVRFQEIQKIHGCVHFSLRVQSKSSNHQTMISLSNYTRVHRNCNWIFVWIETKFSISLIFDRRGKEIRWKQTFQRLRQFFVDATQECSQFVRSKKKNWLHIQKEFISIRPNGFPAARDPAGACD